MELVLLLLLLGNGVSMFISTLSQFLNPETPHLFLTVQQYTPYITFNIG